MTLAQFECLDRKGRTKVVARGTCIAERCLPKYTVSLFQLDNFYIEVYYSAKYSSVFCIRGFNDADALEPYLEKIPIEGLFTI